MKALLDACVLVPTVMREVLVGAADAGFYTPLWSERILGEWERAAARFGEAAQAQATSEIALLNASRPGARVEWAPSLQARLWLPDAGDTHVLAAAISGSADVIVTLNARDFPRGVLAEEGLSRADPDAFLLGFWKSDPHAMQAVCDAVLDKARALSPDPWEMRPLLKKARLPRLAKAVAG